MIDDLAVVLVIVIWVHDLWQIYLFMRQLSLANVTSEMPKSLTGYYDPTAYATIREHFQQAISAFVLTAVVELFIKTLSLTTPYHSSLWSVTTGLSREARPPAFAALHTIATRMYLVPFVMLAAFAAPKSDRKPSPLVILMVSAIHIASAALHTALFLYTITLLVDSFGVEIFVYFASSSPIIGLLVVTLVITIVRPMELQKLAVLNIAGLIQNLAIRVGFNPENIYVNPNDDEPNASHAGMLGFSIIVITRAVVSALSPRQVCAVVAHELGHWAYGLQTLQFLTFTGLLSLGFLFSSYGMSDDLGMKMFSLQHVEDRPHVSVLVYLGLCYVWPVIYSILGGLYSCIGRNQEFKADDYAAQHGYSSDLKTSLLSLYVRTGQYPVQDKWFSAWYHAHPSLIERIKRVDNTDLKDLLEAIYYLLIQALASAITNLLAV